MTKFGIFVHCRLIWCLVGGLVGGCGARAVSRKTPIDFMITYDSDNSGVYDDMMPMTRPSHPCHCPASGWRRPARSGKQAGGGKGIP